MPFWTRGLLKECDTWRWAVYFCANNNLFSKKSYSVMLVMLVWKITQFCKQIKTNQVFKIKSLVLNRVAEWTVIVLNRFSVWGPWWYTSSQTFFSWPTFFPLPGTRGHSKKMALNKLSLPKANEISSDLKVFFRTWNLAEFMLYPKIVYQKK